jgi:hypothetical protein
VFFLEFAEKIRDVVAGGDFGGADIVEGKEREEDSVHVEAWKVNLCRTEE